MNRHADRYARWGKLLPYLLALIVLLALGVIVFASGQQIVGTAVQLAEEDAAMMNWWQQNQRNTLSNQATMLAERLHGPGEFDEWAEAVGLTNHAGYVAWLDGEKTERAALNSSARLGEPAETKLFGFAPALGQAAADFWHSDGQPYWMSMAPVDPELGGGVIVIQQPITDATVADLAARTGRDVIFYSFADQTPLLSSAPALIGEPPRLDSGWMNSVATGQLPDSTRANNGSGDLIVGMTAFPDFARISYSGYLGLVEPTRQVLGLIPQMAYWGLALVGFLLMLVGAFVVQRMMQRYLHNRREMAHAARRRAKLRVVGVTFLFLLPALLLAGYIVNHTSNASAHLDLRTAQIAKDVLIDAADALTTQVDDFAQADTAQTLPADSPAALAETLRRAHALEFAVVDAGGEVVQSGNEELTTDAIAALQTIGAGKTQIVQDGKTVLLAGHQPGPNGAATFAGVPLNKRLSQVADEAPPDLTLVRTDEAVVTTLAEREIESLYFDETVEQELRTDGQSSYLQQVGWNPGKLTAYVLNIADSEEWRLIISQASITWSNAVRAYQAVSLATMTLVVLVAIGLLMTLLNLDKPLLLRRLYTGYLFILPAVVWLVWWQLGPALFAAYLSFHKWSVLSAAKPFVGLHNYRLIMEDDKFWNAMLNTFIYVTQIPLGMALALALALALNRPLRGIRALRTIYYMPAVTSIVVVSLMWKLLYNKDLGIFNYLLSFFGLGPYGFLQSPTMALPSIMAMAVWLGLGARMILFLAGLQSIPNDYYEAADVDGANAWSKFWHITIPLLAPTTFFVFITSIIASFQVFGPVYVLTQGGPAGATDVAVHRIYFEAWQNLRFGYASAETVILFAFLFIVTAIQFRYFGRRVSYG